MEVSWGIKRPKVGKGKMVNLDWEDWWSADMKENFLRLLWLFMRKVKLTKILNRPDIKQNVADLSLSL